MLKFKKLTCCGERGMSCDSRVRILHSRKIHVFTPTVVDLQAKELEIFRKNSLPGCPVCKNGSHRENRAKVPASVHRGIISNNLTANFSQSSSRRGLSLVSSATAQPSSSGAKFPSTKPPCSPSRVGKTHQTSRPTRLPSSARFAYRPGFSHLAFSDIGDKTQPSHPAAVSSPPFDPAPNLKREQDWSVKFHNEGRKDLKVCMV
jgi:hypothetical protein